MFFRILPFKKANVQKIIDRLDYTRGIDFIKHLPNLIKILSNLDFPDENGNINCENCTNCFNCINCNNCNNCNNCVKCNSCEYCNNCLNCSTCKNNNFCSTSSRCDTCKYCQNCQFCNKCDSLDQGYELKEITDYRRSREEKMLLSYY